MSLQMQSPSITPNTSYTIKKSIKTLKQFTSTQGYSNSTDLSLCTGAHNEQSLVKYTAKKVAFTGNFTKWLTPEEFHIHLPFSDLGKLSVNSTSSVCERQENYRIMERILEFTEVKTPGKPWIFRLVNTGKCLENAAFYANSPCVFWSVKRHFFCRDTQHVYSRVTLLRYSSFREVLGIKFSNLRDCAVSTSFRTLCMNVQNVRSELRPKWGFITAQTLKFVRNVMFPRFAECFWPSWRPGKLE